MAVTIPESALRQPSDTASQDDNAISGFAIQYKGPYSDLSTASKSFEQGDEVEAGWVLKSWTLQRLPGNRGLLTLSCVSADAIAEDDEVTLPKKETWSLKSVRNDMSIFAYCGNSEGAHPNRYQLEMWMKETDKSLVDQYKFKDGKDEIQTLSSPSQALAKKIAKGIESVIRFYPLIIRKRLYSSVPSDQFNAIGYINDPPAPGLKAKTPKGLASVVARYSWLKVQDDADEQADSDWLRVESWMGIAKDDGSWDVDLYGPNRWPMPYQA